MPLDAPVFAYLIRGEKGERLLRCAKAETRFWFLTSLSFRIDLADKAAFGFGAPDNQDFDKIL